MENIKKIKISDAKRICNQFGCKEVLQSVIDKIASLETIEDVNDFSTASEVFALKDSFDFKKMRKTNYIKETTERIIINDYPVWKQINIHNLLNGHTEQEKADMVAFIEEKIAFCNQKEAEIMAAKTEEELNNIDI